MTLQAFLNKYNGKYIDFDHSYGNQCVDLIQQYNKELFNGPFLSGNTAVDVWNNYPKFAQVYDKIDNTPTNIPQPGDIIFFKFNHTAVVVIADVMSITSFDQNYPTGSSCHFQEHDYTQCLGWFRP